MGAAVYKWMEDIFTSGDEELTAGIDSRRSVIAATGWDTPTNTIKIQVFWTEGVVFRV